MAESATPTHAFAPFPTQCPGPLNTLPYCGVDFEPAWGSTVYYPSTNMQNAVIYGTANASCQTSAYAPVYLMDGNTGNSLGPCGCLPLDGKPHYLECPGVPKGTLPSLVSFQIDVANELDQQDTFTVIHEPLPTSTVTEAQPTTMITYTKSDTATVNIYETETFTVSIPQITVTKVAKTVTDTITITPTPVSKTKYITTTSTITDNITSMLRKTSTHTAPCTTTKKGHGREKRGSSPTEVVETVHVVPVAASESAAATIFDSPAGEPIPMITITPSAVEESITITVAEASVSEYFTLDVTVTETPAKPTVTVLKTLTSKKTKKAPTPTVTESVTMFVFETIGSIVTRTTTVKETVTPACKGK